ncbi:MAG TPA: TetR/AcrR family transcriptional regulator [Pseudonocardia sp.]|jgi:TetR/AcrR family transcriptional repressor of nem operon|nr:TetR/AcrR family transcriptional regulator [Pseudonocardia sp.]
MPRPREFDDGAALDAAMETFWTKGYEATTTAELCENTGLGRGSLYNAFGSKHALYEAALSRYTEIGYTSTLDILRAPGRPVERLRALLLWVIDTDLGDPHRRGCLAINASLDTAGRSDPVVELTRRHFERLEQALREVIEEGQRAGEFAPDRDSGQLARTLQSTYYGLRVIGSVTQDRAALLDVAEGALAALR